MNKALTVVLSTGFAAVLAAGATAALAQAPAPGAGSPPAAQGSGPAAHGPMHHNAMKPAERAEARLAYIKTALKITPAQEPQWNAYANFVRKNAGDMHQRMEQRMQSGAPHRTGGERPNAIERLERQQAFLAQASKRVGDLLAVEKPLYESLSVEQRKIADEVLGERARPMQARFRRG
jgi:protein CpxP